MSIKTATEQATQLANTLLDEASVPCMDVQSGLSCAARQSMDTTEFASYAHDKMCLTCRAYWYASMAQSSLMRAASLMNKFSQPIPAK